MTDFPAATSEFTRKQMFDQMSSSNLFLIQQQNRITIQPSSFGPVQISRHLNEESSVEIKVLRNALLPSQVLKTQSLLTKFQLQLNHPLIKFEGVHYDIEGNLQSNQE